MGTANITVQQLFEQKAPAAASNRVLSLSTNGKCGSATMLPTEEN